MINQIKSQRVQIVPIALHVGLGTFAPVKEKVVENHQMHEEFFQLSAKAIKQLVKAKKAKKRIIAVGTTSCRVLETVSKSSKLSNFKTLKKSFSNHTKLFIYPPYKFNFVDALITNFHLSKSTLLMLVSAFGSWPNPSAGEEFISFGKSFLGKAYCEAIKKKYRFYSFGNAMLII